MKDFILAAFPFVIMGISIIVIVVNSKKIKKIIYLKECYLVR